MPGTPACPGLCFLRWLADAIPTRRRIVPRRSLRYSELCLLRGGKVPSRSPARHTSRPRARSPPAPRRVASQSPPARPPARRMLRRALAPVPLPSTVRSGALARTLAARAPRPVPWMFARPRRAVRDWQRQLAHSHKKAHQGMAAPLSNLLLSACALAPAYSGMQKERDGLLHLGERLGGGDDDEVHLLD
ncbi:hypothetical protein DFH11DRAFT_1874330 [Phellopilus nigrolimitatus]|nr:hypothetical protein DFH11DRAFT_1874330 [Phellopilus nigrolimitatus]